MIKVIAPTLNVNDDRLKVLAVFVKDGDLVKKGDIILEVESSKATEDILAPADGIVRLDVQEGDSVAAGSILAYIFESQQEYDNFSKENSSRVGGEEGPMATEKAIALARKAGIDIAKIKPEGKVIKQSDVRRFLERQRETMALDEFRFPEAGFVDVEALKTEMERFKGQSDVGEISLEFYRGLGANIGDSVSIGKGSYILAKQIVIEDGVEIGADVEIVAERVFIGRMALIGNGVSVRIRDFYLGDVSLIGDKSLLGGGDSFGPNAGIYIGKRCFVGRESILDAGDGIILREHSCLSPRVCVYTHSHWQDYLKGYNPSFGRVEIARDVHIGGGALIGPGVFIGEGSFVMANSLVVSRVGRMELWGGVPAERKGEIKEISDPKTRQERFGLVYKKMIDYLKKAGIETEKIQYIPILERRSLKDNTILLCFGYDFEIDENYLISNDISLFDLDRYRFYGKQNRVSDAVRNFLRRYGIKFEPIYWRPSPTNKL